MDESRSARLAEIPNSGRPESSKTQTQVCPPAKPSPSHRRRQVTRSINDVSSAPRLRRTSTREEHSSSSQPQSKPKPPATPTTAAASPQGAAVPSPLDVPRPHQLVVASDIAVGGSQVHPSVVSPARPNPDPSRRVSAGAAQAAAPDEPPPMPSTSNTGPSLSSRLPVPPSSAAASRDAEGDGASGSGIGVGLGLEKIEGLNRSILELGTFTETATRRLDDTYYSVLERLSMLQRTVVAIKELARMSKQMDHEFQSESSEVVADTNFRLKTLGGFEHQETRIKVLQERILCGRDKINALSQRVDVVGGRIDGWEKADKDWQERTRKRLKIIWFLIMIIVAVFCLLFVFTPPPVGSKLPPGTAVPPTFLGSEGPGASNRTGVNFKPGCTGSDERLRVFDEL